MLDREEIEVILDKYMLDFLDVFQEEMERLPTDEERRIWMSGFIAGCMSIEEAVQNQLDR